jgi:hypothetical protein
MSAEGHHRAVIVGCGFGGLLFDDERREIQAP